jgi:hypothetical protein
MASFSERGSSDLAQVMSRGSKAALVRGFSKKGSDDLSAADAIWRSSLSKFEFTEFDTACIDSGLRKTFHSDIIILLAKFLY